MNNISNILLERLSEYITKNMGLYFPQKNWVNFKIKIGNVAQNFNFNDLHAFIEWILSDSLAILVAIT